MPQLSVDQSLGSSSPVKKQKQRISIFIIKIRVTAENFRNKFKRIIESQIFIYTGKVVGNLKPSKW